MPPTATPVIPLLTPLDTAIFVIAVGAAMALAFIRAMHKIEVGKGQFLADATGVWTIIVLLLISLSTFSHQAPFFPNLEIPAESELIRSNGVLIPIAFMYCAVMIASNLIDGVWKRWRAALVVVIVWVKKRPWWSPKDAA